MHKLWKANTLLHSQNLTHQRLLLLHNKKIEGYIINNINKNIIDDIINAIDGFKPGMSTWSTK